MATRQKKRFFLTWDRISLTFVPGTVEQNWFESILLHCPRDKISVSFGYFPHFLSHETKIETMGHALFFLCWWDGACCIAPTRKKLLVSPKLKAWPNFIFTVNFNHQFQYWNISYYISKEAEWDVESRNCCVIIKILGYLEKTPKNLFKQVFGYLQPVK